MTREQAERAQQFHTENRFRPGKCVVFTPNGYSRTIRGQFRLPIRCGRTFIQLTDALLNQFHTRTECPFCHGNRPPRNNSFADMATNPYSRIPLGKTTYQIAR